MSLFPKRKNDWEPLVADLLAASTRSVKEFHKSLENLLDELNLDTPGVEEIEQLGDLAVGKDDLSFIKAVHVVGGCDVTHSDRFSVVCWWLEDKMPNVKKYFSRREFRRLCHKSYQVGGGTQKANTLDRFLHIIRDAEGLVHLVHLHWPKGRSRPILRHHPINPDEKPWRTLTNEAEEAAGQRNLKSAGLFEHLILEKGRTGIYPTTVRRAFSIERVTNRFYEAVTNFTTNKLVPAMETAKENDPKFAAITLLNQLIFLRFVEKLGWLDGKKNFFKERLFSAHHLGKAMGLNSDFEGDAKTTFAEYLEAVFQGLAIPKSKWNQKLSKQHLNLIQGLDRLPFLNGGLFPPGHRVPRIPNRIFRIIYQNIFDRFNFTAQEDTPHEQTVAVNPDMLGMIYESMALEMEGTRSEAGAFYTPRDVVDYMARQSIIHLLEHRCKDYLTPQQVFELVTMEDDLEAAKILAGAKGAAEKLDVLLPTFKVLDPCVGSGAFPMGVMMVLEQVRLRVDHALPKEYWKKEDRPAPGDENYSYQVRASIVRDVLHGLDINPRSLEICKLRLWLALAIDFTPPKDGTWNTARPLLPNLGYQFVAGDAILEGLFGYPWHKPFMRKSKEIIELSRKVKEYHDAFFTAVEPEERERCQKAILKVQREFVWNMVKPELIEKMKGVFSEQIQFGSKTEKSQLESYRYALASACLGRGNTSKVLEKILDVAKQRMAVGSKKEKEDAEIAYKSIYGMAGVIKTIDRPLDDILASEIDQSRKEENQINRILFPITFPDVFGKEMPGFDIVIGNPPYVRQEEIGKLFFKDDKKAKAYKTDVQKAISLEQAYLTTPAKPQHILGGRTDLYGYFMLKSHSLMKDNGIFCFITSNSWLDVGYGGPIQGELLWNTYILSVADVKLVRQFGAAVNTVVTITRLATSDERTEGTPRSDKTHNPLFIMFERRMAPYPEKLRIIVSTEKQLKVPELGIHSVECEPDQDGGMCDEKLRAVGVPNPSIWAGGTAGVVSDDEEEVTENKSVKSGKQRTELSFGVYQVDPLSLPYKCDKWGGKYLRAPESYYNLLCKGDGKLVRLKDIADVRFGIKTGANDFFFFKRSGNEYVSEGEWSGDISEDYFRKVARGPKQFDYYTTEIRNFECYLLCADTSKGTEKDLKQLISWGEKQGFHIRKSVQGRGKWWSIEPPVPADILWVEFMGTVHQPLLAKGRLLESDKFYGIVLKDKKLIKTTFASLFSTLGIIQKLLSGFPSMGDGVLKTPVSETKHFYVIPEIKESVLEHFINNLSAIKAVDVWDVISDEVFIGVDDWILKSLGLNETEVFEIRTDCILLTINRLSKAAKTQTAIERIIDIMKSILKNNTNIASNKINDFIDALDEAKTNTDWR
jgi:hypothetical protein